MPILYDEQDRPYLQNRDGKRNYISPVAMARGREEHDAAIPKDETGMFRQAPRWNNSKGKWETPLDFTNIMNMAVIGGLTAGAGNMAMAGAAPAAAGSGGTLASSSPLFGAASMSTPGIGLTSGGASLVGGAVPLSSGVVPLSSVTASPAVAGSAIPGGSGVGSSAVPAAGGSGAVNQAVEQVADKAGGGGWRGQLKNHWRSIFDNGMQVVGAHQSSRAAKDAAKIQHDAVQRAIDFEMQRYREMRQNSAPYRDAGSGAIKTLNDRMQEPRPDYGAMAGRVAQRGAR